MRLALMGAEKEILFLEFMVSWLYQKTSQIEQAVKEKTGRRIPGTHPGCHNPIPGWDKVYLRYVLRLG